MRSIKEITLTFFAFAFVLLLPHSGFIPAPFGYVIPVLLFIWLFLKRSKENFESIYFSFGRLGIKPALIGTIAGIVIFSFLTWIFFPLLDKLVHLQPADLGDYAKLRGNTGFYIFLLIMGWLVGGVYEEIVFHGFIFTRLEKLVRGRYALVICFLVCNSIFALYHWQLGTLGVINAFIAGSAYHAVMLFNKRNIWYAVFSHAVFDTIALTFIYLGYE